MKKRKRKARSEVWFQPGLDFDSDHTRNFGQRIRILHANGKAEFMARLDLTNTIDTSPSAKGFACCYAGKARNLKSIKRKMRAYDLSNDYPRAVFVGYL